MKRKQLLLVLWVSALLLVSCSEDDDGTTGHPLDGVWYLESVGGGMMESSVAYEEGDVTWTFNVSGLSLEVVNLIDNTGPEDIYAGYDTGTYAIAVVEDDGVSSLYINNQLFGTFTISGNTLMIDQGVASDGYMSTFQRF